MSPGAIVIVVVAIVAILMVAVAMLRLAARLVVAAPDRCRGGRGALDDFVEFAAVELDPAAFRAVVDLYALAVGHH